MYADDAAHLHLQVGVHANADENIHADLDVSYHVCVEIKNKNICVSHFTSQ